MTTEPLATELSTATARPPTAPQLPRTLEALGLNPDLVSGLVLRHLAAVGTLSGAALEARMGVPYEAFQPLLDEHIKSHLIEQGGYATVTPTEGRPVALRMNHVISDAGRRRVAELAETSTMYLGPCPVNLETFVELALHQEENASAVTPSSLATALADLELEPGVLEEVGSAMASRSSLFLYGPPGNGKSSIARAMAHLLGGPIEVPYAIALGEEVIRVLDPMYHRPVVHEQSADRRFERVARPVVRAGGELSFTQLELTYNQRARYYEAPLQVKASGGVLVIDDFGRQAESPVRLLNRFIVPMEEHVDFLDLAATGHKVEVPFTCQVVFSTNLSPAELVDEAFLRRISYKVLVNDPTLEQYSRILERECRRAGIALPPQALPFLQELYKGRPMRGSHPRQLVARIVDRARYRGEQPQITRESLQHAFDAYLNPAFLMDVRASYRALFTGGPLPPPPAPSPPTA